MKTNLRADGETPTSTGLATSSLAVGASYLQREGSAQPRGALQASAVDSEQGDASDRASEPRDRRGEVVMPAEKALRLWYALRQNLSQYGGAGRPSTGGA